MKKSMMFVLTMFMVIIAVYFAKNASAKEAVDYTKGEEVTYGHAKYLAELGIRGKWYSSGRINKVTVYPNEKTVLVPYSLDTVPIILFYKNAFKNKSCKYIRVLRINSPLEILNTDMSFCTRITDVYLGYRIKLVDKKFFTTLPKGVRIHSPKAYAYKAKLGKRLVKKRKLKFDKKTYHDL